MSARFGDSYLITSSPLEIQMIYLKQRRIKSQLHKILIGTTWLDFNWSRQALTLCRQSIFKEKSRFGPNPPFELFLGRLATEWPKKRFPTQRT